MKNVHLIDIRLGLRIDNLEPVSTFTSLGFSFVDCQPLNIQRILFTHASNHSNPLKPTQTHSTPLNPTQPHSNPLKP